MGHVMPLVFLSQQASEVKISRKIKEAVPLRAKLPFNVSLGKLCFVRVAIIFVCPDPAFGFVLMAYSNNNGHNKNVFMWLELMNSDFCSYWCSTFCISSVQSCLQLL